MIKSSDGLTSRQMQILKGIGDGLCTKEIARLHGLAEQTVWFHRGHLRRIFNTDSPAMLVKLAIGFGLSKL